jgi:hypothetical protein
MMACCFAGIQQSVYSTRKFFILRHPIYLQPVPDLKTLTFGSCCRLLRTFTAVGAESNSEHLSATKRQAQLCEYMGFWQLFGKYQQLQRLTGHWWETPQRNSFSLSVWILWTRNILF